MRLHFIYSTAVLFALFAASAHAVEVLDQQNDLTGAAGSDTAGPFGQEIAQTFTVGVAGTLSRIETQIIKIGPGGGQAILTVFNTSGGVPNASLGTATLNANTIPGTGYAFFSFDVSSFAIPVAVNDVHAFSIKSSGESLFGLRSSFDMSTYPGGESKFRSTGPPPGPWQSFPFTHDYGFKTYVNAAAPVATPGDFNDDGLVDAADYIVWRKYLNDPSEAALNGNGDNMNGVDDGDYNLWRENFAEGSSGGSLPVPEPGTWLLCLIAVLGAMPTARRAHVSRP